MKNVRKFRASSGESSRVKVLRPPFRIILDGDEPTSPSGPHRQAVKVEVAGGVAGVSLLTATVEIEVPRERRICIQLRRPYKLATNLKLRINKTGLGRIV